MNLNDLLQTKRIDPKHVLVLRHRPHEQGLNRVLPWLAAEKHDVFNAYQQTQTPTLERAMKKMSGNGYLASLIRHGPGRALFVGLYSIDTSKPLSYRAFWRIPAYIELKSLGMTGFTGERRSSILWFDLELTDFYSHWKGKLVIGWPPPERSWFRRAHRNEFPVLAVLEESALVAGMPAWDKIDLTWEQLRLLPSSWKITLRQWRGIYYIFDTSDGKGYVGAAYGNGNLLERWENYAARGHGGNQLLRQHHARNFRFTILQLMSPHEHPEQVMQLEASWKERLHTRAPRGLNDN